MEYSVCLCQIKPAKFFFTGNDQLLLAVYKAVSYFWDHHTSNLNNEFLKYFIIKYFKQIHIKRQICSTIKLKY